MALIGKPLSARQVTFIPAPSALRLLLRVDSQDDLGNFGPRRLGLDRIEQSEVDRRVNTIIVGDLIG